MATGIIGRKLGMTRVFTEDGTAVPVTVIEAGPCHVLQVSAYAGNVPVMTNGSPSGLSGTSASAPTFAGIVRAPC